MALNGLVLLAEVCAVLAKHERCLCVPTVTDDGALSIRLVAGGCTDLELLAVVDEFRYLVDMAQIRAFADRYGIDAAALEAVCRGRKEEPQ